MIIQDGTVVWETKKNINTVNNIDPDDSFNIDLNIKFFNSLEQIGITKGQETLLSITKALPDNSILMYYPNSNIGYADIYPHVSIESTSQWYGLMRVYKANSVAIFDFSAQVLGENLFSRHWKISISSSELGSADAANKKWQELQYKINRVEDLGLDRSTLTLRDLAKALPFGVTIEFYVSKNGVESSGYPNIFPTLYGYFRATRANNTSLVLFEFFAVAGPPVYSEFNTGYYVATYAASDENNIKWCTVKSIVGDVIIKNSATNKQSASFYQRYSNNFVHVIQMVDFPANVTYFDATPIIPMERVINAVIANNDYDLVTKSGIAREFRFNLGRDGVGASYNGLVNDKIRITANSSLTGADTLMLEYWGYTKE